MEEVLIERRNSPLGFTIKVDLTDYSFIVYTPKGAKEISRVPGEGKLFVPRIIFLGQDFNLDHFVTGELTFVNTKDLKMLIPYQHGGSKDLKFISFFCFTESDIAPVILYHYKDSKEIVKAYGTGYIFKHIVVDETLPRNEMVNLKIRFPQVNIFIHKKKLS